MAAALRAALRDINNSWKALATVCVTRIAAWGPIPIALAIACYRRRSSAIAIAIAIAVAVAVAG
ncbi:hypothetical protein ACF07L_03025 [Streptomyces anulatus]|uniref:hypothetical protein n=1 Tax=Streptomyces anulatus TaxID=1892 RepID=UPI0036F7B109